MGDGEEFKLLSSPEGSLLLIGESVVGLFARNGRSQDGCRDDIKQVEAGVFLWKRTFLFSEDSNERLLMDFRAFHSAHFWMVPAVCYGGNPFGHGNDIKGFFHEGAAYTYASHRASLPGATYSEGPNWSVGMMAAEPTGSFSIFSDGDDAVVHRLILPEEEQPVRYVERKKVDGKHVEVYADGVRERPRWKAGQRVEMRACVVVCPVEKRQRRAYRRFLDFGWGQFEGDDPPLHYSPEEIWRIGVRFALDSLWDEEAGFFSTGLRCRSGQWTRARKYAVGFVGQNLSLANSLLYDYTESGIERHREVAVGCLNNWIEVGFRDSGVFIGAHGEDGAKGGHANASHMGKAAEQFFEAARLQEGIGGTGSSFRHAALRICEFGLSQQDASGLVPGNWNEDGTVLERRGTIGSCFIGPWVMAWECTRDERFLQAAMQSFCHYMAFFRENGFVGGATLDTFCIERESGFSLVVGGLRLYRAMGNREYLEAAEELAYYVATWQFGYKAAPFPEGTPMAQIGFNTRGGTAVATVHPCMDFHALEVMDDFYALGEWLEKPVWKARALSAWRHAQQGISDGTLAFMDRPPRPFGSQDETWFYTHWGLWAPADGNAVLDRPRGHVSQWLVAKPTAGRMEFLRRIGRENWQVLEKAANLNQKWAERILF